uniref:Mitochondrial elongation factor 2 n=1 Tax=Anas platyrhynchos TaxID=8839 RepID=A0A8B9TCA3_ANAPL
HPGAGCRCSRQDDSGLGSVLDVLLANARLVLGVSGAAVLAIATLAVKRVRMVGGFGMGLPGLPRHITLEMGCGALPGLFLACPAPPDPPQAESIPQHCLTLQEKLLLHHSSLLAVHEAQAAFGRQLACSICTELQNFLRNKCPELPFGNLFLSGPLLDGLRALAADHVHFMLPVVLDAALWSLIPGEDTVVRNPRYWLIKRRALEYFPRGCSPWDKFLVGRYLSSNTLNETLHKLLVASINWPAIGSLLGSLIRPVVASRELRLEVKHEELELSIALFPVGLVENLWLESFSRAEASKVRELDAGDAGARQSCLRVLNNVCRSHPALHRLSGSPLVHVVLHLSAAGGDWAEGSLAARFQQVLEELVGYLEQGVLPSYFNHKVNLFGELLEEEDRGDGLLALQGGGLTVQAPLML